MTLIQVFPGQGSQKRGMGEELFERFPERVEEASDILGYSLSDLCLHDSQHRLNETQYTQPALYCVNALSYFAQLEDTGREPDFVAGHSLGEYNALLAAGVFDFGTGLRLVRERGRAMAMDNGSSGGMAAIVGLEVDEVTKILDDAGHDALDVANYNAPTQVVVAGPHSVLKEAEGAFVSRGARFLSLKVSAPFHSRYMKHAQESFAQIVSKSSFMPLRRPVIANYTALPYPKDEVADYLVAQICEPVRWVATVQYLLHEPDPQFEQIGPGNVLTALISRIRRRQVPPRSLRPPRSNVRKDRRRVPVSRPAPQRSVPSSGTDLRIHPEALGSAAFRQSHGLRYAYVAGSMVKGISSPELVERMARAGLLSFLGTGGMKHERIESGLDTLRRRLGPELPYGANLLHNLVVPEHEEKTVDIFLAQRLRHIEASAYINATPALVRYRLSGARRLPDGEISVPNKVMGKVSRPEVASEFLSPPNPSLVASLLAAGKITREEADLAPFVPLADDVCAEADSGGHTDKQVLGCILPTFLRLRDELAARHGFAVKPRLGAAGGLGAPESIAAAFLLGADFVLTGSINQCTVEAGTSDLAKDLLAAANVQDMEMAPAGDMFEIGARIQVLKRGLFFPARANHLYELYRLHGALEQIDPRTLARLEKNYFRRSIEEVWQETREYYQRAAPEELRRAEENPKVKMAMIFRWYFVHTNRLALRGTAEQRVDFQIHCGPAMGAFNQWVKGTPLEDWRRRHVDEIAQRLMQGAARVLEQRLGGFLVTIPSEIEVGVG